MAQLSAHGKATTEPLDEQMDVRAIYYNLYANKWIILAVMALCFTVTFFYLIWQPPLYSASVLLQTENNSNNSASLLSNVNYAIPYTSATEVQVVLIKSRYIMEPVVQSLGLNLTIHNAYFPLIGAWYARHHREHLSKPLLGLKNYAWGGEQLIISQLTAPADNQHFILVAGEEVGTYSLYDQQQQLILTGQVGELARQQTLSPSKEGVSLQVATLIANPGERFFIDKRSSQSIAATLASQLRINDLSANGSTGVLQMSLEGTNPADITRIVNATAKMAVEKNIEKKSTEATNTLAFLNEQLPLVKQGINEAENALNKNRAKAGKIDLDLQSKFLLNQITNAQKQLDEVQLARLDALQKDTVEHPAVKALADKEQALNRVLGALQLKLSKLPMSDQKAVSLLREVKVKSQLYLVLLNKIQSLQVSKAGTLSDIRILSLANQPESPLANNHLNTLFISLILGFLLSATFILVRNALHRQVNNPNVLEQLFGLVNMAIIPFSEQQHLFSGAGDKKRVMPLLSKVKPKDLSIEALRSLRTSLQFSMIGAKNNIITILGVMPNVGKSFISANFAYLLADAGKKILLIDGDIRRGHLKDYFYVGVSKGFSEVVSQQCPFEEVVIKTADNLDFLSSGVYPPNPSELLMSPFLKVFLDKVSAAYDLVIIDTAPILAVTDATVIGAHAGANFLVIASNKHEVDEVSLAIKRLNANDIHLNGSIFNFSMQQKGLYRYDYGYGYGYSYSKHYQAKYD